MDDHVGRDADGARSAGRRREKGSGARTKGCAAEYGVARVVPPSNGKRGYGSSDGRCYVWVRLRTRSKSRHNAIRGHVPRERPNDEDGAAEHDDGNDALGGRTQHPASPGSDSNGHGQSHAEGERASQCTACPLEVRGADADPEDDPPQNCPESRDRKHHTQRLLPGGRRALELDAGEDALSQPGRDPRSLRRAHGTPESSPPWGQPPLIHAETPIPRRGRCRTFMSSTTPSRRRGFTLDERSCDVHRHPL